MKIIKYISILALTLSLNACSDFLDPDSLSTFDTQYVFSNVDDARKATNAIYQHFSEDAFRSRLSNNMTGNTDIEQNSGTGSTARYEIWRLEAQPNNGDLKVVWEVAYKAIRDANIVIDGITKSAALNSTDIAIQKDMKHFLGEAYTLRAYWYSMLIYHFGDVPFSNQAPRAGLEFNLPKEDRNMILSSVIQDMINIEADMKWADELPYGIEQVNREYTLGMIARLALQRGGYFLKPDMTMERKSDYLDYYAIARDYSKKLMDLKDRELPTDFRQVFLNESKFIVASNSDILFEVPFAIGEGDVAWNIGIRVDAGTHPYGSGSNYMNVPPTYYYSFDKKDIRRDVTCGLYYRDKDFKQQVVAIGSISQGKWSREYLNPPPGPSTNKGTGINWPMLRYADVLLMFAEAENELNGPTAAAKAAFARVRQRAFNQVDWPEKVDQYIASVSAGKATFFDAIVDERAWEFGGEMIRKYELIRWNLYDTKINETVEGLKKLADDAYLGFGDLPDYLYWKYDESGNLVILNSDNKVAAAPDDTWKRANWLISLHRTPNATDPSPYQSWITTNWANYTTAPVRYIMPIPSVAVTNSQGLLQNDGYGFNF
ncbi:RagB/SusD family nutrient uptake outer membrane protein [Flavobacterium sp. L1I52]|uniref:RagB/SusD family nutrient uptake outer membrane protein n=1 Tax=Flavobacterium pokkalii TaxID=1940408 RepID=A0ABR7UQC8_9FLAO|nr:RagB/SusD family nutrient uptake outer membrane protein [Flavobacterium pokkalii]MBD0725099.1 RagB/SusD family nutrient uptake outer membrane protein [Flavobacterium pokkalii]